MEPRSINDASAAAGTADQSRREALKRFGRYAAIAPTAMMLLEPRESHAGKKNGFGRGIFGRDIFKRGKGGRGKGWNSHY